MTQTVAHALITPETVLDPLMLQLSRLIGIHDPAPYSRVSIIPFQPLRDGKAAGNHQCVVTLMNPALTTPMWAGLVETQPLIDYLASIPANQGPVGVDMIIDAMGEGVRSRTVHLEPQNIAAKVVERAQIAFQGDYLFHRLVEAAWRTIDPKTTQFPAWVNGIPTGNLYHFARAETDRTLGEDHEGIEFASLVDDEDRHILVLTFFPIPEAEDDEDDLVDNADGPQKNRLTLIPPVPDGHNDSGPENGTGIPEPDSTTLDHADAGDSPEGGESTSHDGSTPDESDTTGDESSEVGAADEDEEDDEYEYEYEDEDEDEEATNDKDEEEGEDEASESSEEGDTSSHEADENGDTSDEVLVHPVSYYFDVVPYLSFIRGVEDSVGREALLDATDECDLHLPDDTVHQRMEVINTARALTQQITVWLSNNVTESIFRSMKNGDSMETAAARGVDRLCQTVVEVMTSPTLIDNNPMLEPLGKMVWKSGVTEATQHYKVTLRRKVKTK